MTRSTMATSLAAAAFLSLAAAGSASAAVGRPLPQAAVAGPDAASGEAALTPVYYRRWHHQRRRVYGHAPAYPGYYYDYGYSPRTDWTTRCMEDLGYGRRGMYGCGR